MKELLLVTLDIMELLVMCLVSNVRRDQSQIRAQVMVLLCALLVYLVSIQLHPK
jgi:hypothetical protein